MSTNNDDSSDPKPVQINPLIQPPESQDSIRAVKNTAIDAVKINMAVEIGRVDMTIKELRLTRQGTVIALDRDVGDPIDIRVNNRLFARGEVVSTEGRKYGIRITEMIVPDDTEEIE